MTVLATAYADKGQGGSGEHEPMLMAIDYGKGRVFHTTLGHSPEAMQCVGFIVTLERGAEWAATGKVSQQKLPEDFPTADEVRTRAKE
jgi:type 1 glutamine amidotransferase